MPNLYVITGSNGAGKSTVGLSYFPDTINTIFDGDKLFLEKKAALWAEGLRVQKELNRLASNFVDDTFKGLSDTALKERSDFAFEGHFSEDSSWNIIEEFKSQGYKLHLIFFGLLNTAISQSRVLLRAKEGGHFVDSLTLRNNFYGNLAQLNRRFLLFNQIHIVETSEIFHKQLFLMEEGKVLSNIPVETLPGWFIQNLPNLVSLINKRKHN